MKREDLLNALTIVKPGLTTKEMSEQSTSFGFIGDRVVTYNDEISISTPVDGLHMILSGAVKAEELFDLLSKIKEEEIEIQQEENQIIITAGKAQAGLVLEQEVKMPLEDMGSTKKVWHAMPVNFPEAINFTLPSISKDQSRPILQCINIQKKGYVESTDNIRLSRYDLQSPVPFDFKIPGNICKELKKYETDRIAEGTGWMHFKSKKSKTIFSCRTYKGEFPNLNTILNLKNGRDFKLPKSLESILERAIVFAEQKTEESTIETIDVFINENTMEVKSENKYGWFKEKTKIKHFEKPFKFSINPTHLKYIAKKLESCTLFDNCMKFSGENWESVVALIPSGK